MFGRNDGKFSETTSGVKTACGGEMPHVDGTCFTIMAGTHGYGMGNILDNRFAVCVDDLYANREPRYYIEETPTLRASRSGLKVQILE